MSDQNRKTSSKTSSKTNTLVKTSMLSVIAFVLMMLESQIPFFPEFLKIDLSDLPALIAGLAMGPLAGVSVEAVKNILHLLMTTTGGIGELANFVIGSSFVIPAALIYRHKKNKVTALIGLVVGVAVMSLTGALANYYVLLPFYSTFMPIDAIIAMSAKANPAIKDLWSLILYGIVPFNIFKGLVLSVLTLAVYKRISQILHQ